MQVSSSMGIKIEQRFKDFNDSIKKNSTDKECQATKDIFFYAYYDCLIVLRDIVGSAEISEEDSVEMLDSLHKESLAYVEKRLRG